ncbi:hypothetical protein [Paenibacillus sp. CECT 9249]|uniref:hypothetical protein n=1 Tax=Paenibacillus sp. CECT 9249 TaxID=2845385 RepID=UPI001E3A3912|nr:hypothetical protein [Paenibacillus sp. CECT 9249]
MSNNAVLAELADFEVSIFVETPKTKDSQADCDMVTVRKSVNSENSDETRKIRPWKSVILSWNRIPARRCHAALVGSNCKNPSNARHNRLVMQSNCKYPTKQAKFSYLCKFGRD